jgi:hypothetical protein
VVGRRTADPSPPATEPVAAPLRESPPTGKETAAPAQLELTDRLGPAPPVDEAEGLGRPHLPGKRWELKGLIKSEGDFQIFEVFDRMFHRPLACKMVAFDRREQVEETKALVREARIMARIGHSAVPSVYEVGWTTDGRSYAILDPVFHHANLAKVLWKLGMGHANEDLAENWSLERFLGVFLTIARCLDAAHQQQIPRRFATTSTAWDESSARSSTRCPAPSPLRWPSAASAKGSSKSKPEPSAGAARPTSPLAR